MYKVTKLNIHKLRSVLRLLRDYQKNLDMLENFSLIQL